MKQDNIRYSNISSILELSSNNKVFEPSWFLSCVSWTCLELLSNLSLIQGLGFFHFCRLGFFPCCLLELDLIHSNGPSRISFTEKCQWFLIWAWTKARPKSIALHKNLTETSINFITLSRTHPQQRKQKAQKYRARKQKLEWEAG